MKISAKHLSQVIREAVIASGEQGLDEMATELNMIHQALMTDYSGVTLSVREQNRLRRVADIARSVAAKADQCIRAQEDLRVRI